jgi:hypothetical protein
MPMGPPPSTRRRLTGEDITPDQVRFTGGLGIKGIMDREQFTNTQNQPRIGYTGMGDYRPSLEAYPSLSEPYHGQSSLAYDNRTSSLYNATPYADTQYTAGQIGCGSMTSTSRMTETRYGQDITFSPHPVSCALQQPYSARPGSMGTYRYGTSRVDNISNDDVARHSATNSLGGLSSIYGGRSEYSDQATGYQDDRSERSMLLSDPSGTSNSHLPGWNSASMSTIDPPRSS